MVASSVRAILLAAIVAVSALALSPSVSSAISRCKNPTSLSNTYITGNGANAVKGVHFTDVYERNTFVDCTVYRIFLRGTIWMNDVKRGDTGDVNRYYTNYSQVYSIPNISGTCNGYAIYVRGLHGYQLDPSDAMGGPILEDWC